MIRDITIGQYYNTDSILHRLDPRVKLMGTLIFLISLFMKRSILAYVVITLALITLIRLSHVPFSYMVKGLKTILFLLCLTVPASVLLTPGTVIFQWKIFTVTQEGVRNAVFTVIRLSYLIIGTSLMTLTTTPNQLTDGLEKGLGFLKALRVPVHEIAMMMSIALRFIPILMEETDKIMKAQMARGADFESGKLWKRIKSMVPLLVPLVISAFRRASDLAMAMEARCYRGGKGRTKMKPLTYRKQDIIAYSMMAVYLAGVFCLGQFLF